MPSGNATVEFDTTYNARKASNLLAGAQLTTIPVKVGGFTHAVHPQFHKQKRLDPDRILQTVQSPATSVIYGIPSRYSVRQVRAFLQDYHLPYFGNAQESIIRLIG